MVIVEVLFLVVFWSWAATAFFFLQTTFLTRDPIRVTPQSLGLPGEVVSFKSTDGVQLEGWKIATDSSHPWIIGCHGLGSNRSDLLDIAQVLHKASFNVLLFDFRSHGGSSGRVTSYGLTEQRDLEGALSFLGSQPEIAAKPYGIYGISMGASVALMVASHDERIQTLALDSPYSDLDASIAKHLKLMYPWLPKQPFLSFIRLTYRLRFGSWMTQVSPVKAAGKLSRQQALLVISGSQDVRMPPEDIDLICKANPAVSCWQIKGAGHLEGYAMNPTAYAKRLTKFFESSLAPVYK